ncbi:MAG: hypothetical protein ACE148_10610 [Vicinamibacterales bacterium]
MTELALTRIFSVTMYYHFAFLAISIALFGLSASGVYVYLARHRLARRETRQLLARRSLAFAAATTVSLAILVRIRVGLNYSPWNLAGMLAIYFLAAVPFFTGGTVVTIALSRLAPWASTVYAADLLGAAVGCLLLIPLLDGVGAPGVILAATLSGTTASVFFAGRRNVWSAATGAAAATALAAAAWLTGLVPFDVADTKGHEGDRILFSRWNSFSRVAVYDRGHGDWSLSPRYAGPLPETRFMDIDSAASTPILRLRNGPEDAAYLRYELTSLAYHLFAARNGDGGGQAWAGPAVLVIGPGGGRDLVSALLFGAPRVDAVEINRIIARDVMLGEFRDYSGGIYAEPRVRVFVEDGRSFVRRSRERYDVIQASLVDTWAATAAGAYTLTENSLYTVEAFGDYLDHLSASGVLSITRWVFDGLRLVSLARAACEERGLDASERIVVIGHDKVATFLLKSTPFTAAELSTLTEVSRSLDFEPLYLPGQTVAGNEYAALALAEDPGTFYERHRQDVRPTTDDRPFFFHTTKLADQWEVAFGRSMLFGNGLSALLTLMVIATGLVVSFILAPLAVGGRGLLGTGWAGWLTYFGLLGGGFMLIEVALLQRFVLLLGHPVYSLTVTLFALLTGGGFGSFASRSIAPGTLRRRIVAIACGVSAAAIAAMAALPAVVSAAIAMPLPARIALAALLLLPAGFMMGMPLPGGIRIMCDSRPELVPWAWAMNGALSVVGAVLAVFIAMNWGFSATLATGAALYALAALVLWLQGGPHVTSGVASHAT